MAQIQDLMPLAWTQTASPPIEQWSAYKGPWKAHVNTAVDRARWVLTKNAHIRADEVQHNPDGSITYAIEPHAELETYAGWEADIPTAKARLEKVLAALETPICLSGNGVAMWLDDLRAPPDDTWTWVKDAHSAIRLLASGAVRYASLDHDLGDDRRGDGTTVADFMERAAYYGWIPRIAWAVHSANPSGAERMISALIHADGFWTSAPVNPGVSA